ncbi:nicotinate-nucleotide adenylyltransferase [Thermodesulfitimonas autotrophica]|uniref:Probable nicotinate-nucleotide adenylyltransferase n=2 Tax=Thermodesulfitimonas autotrophica TaxID=1894989 RepID=A0A3N5APU0_9THEO|nr:nicotinate-nucleotide adenylyltransferase [Thermodesulfitimonas autotrophica]
MTHLFGSYIDYWLKKGYNLGKMGCVGTAVRIGLMGGTFDPIHYGHLVAAEDARYELGLEKVVFIPAGQPPHKPKELVSEAAHRVAMVRLAIATNPCFELSTVEVERPGPSYTVDTVAAFRKQYPAGEFYFITGADAVAEILSWHRAEELLTLCRVVAVTRPGYVLDNLRERLAGLDAYLWRKIRVLPVPGVAISSTAIRERVREGRPIRYLLPDQVEAYIKEQGLYRLRVHRGIPRDQD